MLNDFVIRLLENSLIMSAAIFILWGLSHLLRDKTSSRMRFVCWLAVAIGMLLPVRPVLYTITLPQNVTTNISAYVSNVFGQLDFSESAAADIFAKMLNTRSDFEPIATADTTEHDYGSDTASIRSSGLAPVPSAPIQLPRLRDLTLFILWVMGVFVFLLLCTLRHRRFIHSVRRWSRPVTDIKLQSLMEDVCREVKLRRHLRLFICPLVATPVAIGLWNPAVILPDDAIEYQHLRLILLHEALHCKRGDIWFKALSLMAVAAHWFNPLAYFMNRALAAEIELVCDADVLRYAGAGQRYEYGEIILYAAYRGREVSTPLALAFSSGGGKSLKRRLSGIMECRTARKWVSVCLSAVMICSMLLTGLVGCNGASDIAPVKADMTPTNELLLYTPPLFGSHWQPVIARYQELYPDVNVTVEDFPVDFSIWNYDEIQEGYTSRLISELAAGNGPDVVFLHSLFSPTGKTNFDIHKMMDSGRLLDLKETLEQDESFNRDDYFMNVLEAGAYKGRQFLLPFSFNVPVTLSKSQVVEQIGLDLSKNTDFSSFMAEMLRCLPAAKQNPGYQAMMTAYQMPTLFFNAGVQLIDYENKIVLPDEKGFRAFCESYKSYYTYENTDLPLQDIDKAFLAGSVVYKNETYSVYGFLSNAAVIENDGGASISAIRGMDGKLNATAIDYVSINAASKNQLNAYNFIKLLLSPEVQALDSEMSNIVRGFPVHKDSLAAVCEREWKAGENNTYTDWNGAEYPLKPISQEKYDLFMEIVTGVDNCTVIDFGPAFSAVEIFMTPYFKGEKSYEDCVSELKARFNVFLSE